MKKMLLSVLLAGVMYAPAFSAPNDITLPIISNVFTTAVSESSAPQRSVRAGLSTTTGRPSVILNVPGAAPVVLANINGALSYNGVAIATNAFVGNSMSVVDTLDVGGIATFTSGVLMSSTLDVNGIATVGKLDTGYGANELFDMDQHVMTSSAVSFTDVTNLGKLAFFSRSKAQLNAISPAAVGEAYFCNDCSPLKLVVSTGTSAANFAAADGGAFQ